MLTCLIFVATEWQGDRLDKRLVWAQHPESGRDWYYAEPLTNDHEDDILNLPRSVMLRFEPLPVAHFRNSEVFAFRMGIAEMDGADLNRDWIAAKAPAIVFREPKDECDWSGLPEDS